jgi:hypothetical protein
MGFDHFVLEVYAIPRKEGQRFIYFAISHLTRFVYAMELNAFDANSAAVFLKQLVANAPFKTHTITTENHSAFLESELDPWSPERPGFGHIFRTNCWKNKVSPYFKPSSGYEAKPIGFGWPKVPRPRTGRRYLPRKEPIYEPVVSLGGRYAYVECPRSLSTV